MSFIVFGNSVVYIAATVTKATLWPAWADLGHMMAPCDWLH